MTTKRAERRRRTTCHHRPEYETDWLGRTYRGCPVCNRWKLMKAKPAPPDSKRIAA